MPTRRTKMASNFGLSDMYVCVSLCVQYLMVMVSLAGARPFVG